MASMDCCAPCAPMFRCWNGDACKWQSVGSCKFLHEEKLQRVPQPARHEESGEHFLDCSEAAEPPEVGQRMRALESRLEELERQGQSSSEHIRKVVAEVDLLKQRPVFEADFLARLLAVESRSSDREAQAAEVHERLESATANGSVLLQEQQAHEARLAQMEEELQEHRVLQDELRARTALAEELLQRTEESEVMGQRVARLEAATEAMITTVKNMATEGMAGEGLKPLSRAECPLPQDAREQKQRLQQQQKQHRPQYAHEVPQETDPSALDATDALDRSAQTLGSGLDVVDALDFTAETLGGTCESSVADDTKAELQYPREYLDMLKSCEGWEQSDFNRQRCEEAEAEVARLEELGRTGLDGA